ncbi:hypothetical protein [Hymenobacter properus]|uniref:Lipocalin-like domain-containing protein n=1 Tax=Hymenobacter properus TaxID=2791026 RepID=A0A931BEV0_9BACT|nr:hypothetical protein [Hymenobacter properus]MBF9141173.1 hypothetical protein [Hymenobacter properus]MBR7719982.1 hypothetical protein [Microvirga sp. SRT04]
MKKGAACLFLGLFLSQCAPSASVSTPSPVGRWEQLGVRRVTYDAAGQLLADEYNENAPGSVWLELTANSKVYLWHNGFAKPTGTMYIYRADTLRFRDTLNGETLHPITVLSRHRLIYQTHKQENAGTEDATFMYRR